MEGMIDWLLELTKKLAENEELQIRFDGKGTVVVKFYDWSEHPLVRQKGFAFTRQIWEQGIGAEGIVEREINRLIADVRSLTS